MKFLKNSSTDIANVIFYTILVVFGTIPIVLFIIFGGLGILFTVITDPMAIVWTVMPYLIIGLIVWIVVKVSEMKSKAQSSRSMPRPSSTNKQQPSANERMNLLPQTSNKFALPNAMDKPKYPAFFESDGEIFKVFVENEMLRAAIFERKSSTFVNVPGVLEITREGFEISPENLPAEVKSSLSRQNPFFKETREKPALEAMNRVAMEAKNREWENRKKLLREKFIAALEEEKQQSESKNNNQPIELLGHKISQETHPKLYERAVINKPWLEEQILTIAEKWQDGDVATAINVFEMDLQHL